MMHILDRYIRHTVISATVLVVWVLTGVECFAQLITEVPFVGIHQYDAMMMLYYIVMQLPAIVYMAFPIAAFIGCLLGMGRLATASELTVMRANGVSIGQITWSVIKAALLMLIVITAFGEFAAPQLQVKADVMRAKALHKPSSMQAKSKIWLHHQNSYIYIDRVKSATEIAGVSQFFFKDKKLDRLRYAKTGRKIGKRWQLYDIVSTKITQTHTYTDHAQTAWLNFNFTPNKLHDYEGMTLQGSVLELHDIVKLRKSAGLVATLFQLTFWQRVIQPITTIVMICLGVPFVFGSLRSVSATVRVVAGIAVGITFYMLNRFFGPVTLLYQFPPVLAAFCPTLLFLSIYAYMLRRIS